MGRRNRSVVSDFLTAFNQVYDTTGRVAEDIELSKVARAKPEESQGFTADQGVDLEAAAARGDKIDIAYKDDGQGNQVFDRYVVTPKMGEGEMGPPQSRDVAMQGVTDFLGNRTAGKMDEGQVNNARQRAMAGVVMKSDPVRGAAMMRDVKRDERDDQRFGWEQSRNERQIRLDAETDAEKALMQDLDAKTGEWFKSRLTGPDGNQRAATVDDHLAASQFRAAQLMAAGKTDAAGQVMKDYNAQSLLKINLDTAQRKQALGQTAAALAAGDLNAVKDFYNQFIPDGAQVTNVQRGENGQITIERQRLDGTPLPPTTMKNTDQLVAAMSMFENPQALYQWSQAEFQRNMAIRADNRASAAFAQGQADRAQGKSDAAARAEAGVALFKENNPNATPAQIEAVRRGVIDPVPRADGSAPADVKLAQAALSAGVPGVTDMASALQWARGKSETTPQEMHTDFVNASIKNMMRPADAVAAADEVMREMGFVKQGGRWTAPSGRAAAGAVAPIQKGQVVDGYEFQGGDPKDQKNWRQVATGNVQ